MWVERLGDDRLDVRIAARAELMRMGTIAAAQVLKALEHERHRSGVARHARSSGDCPCRAARG